MQPKSTNNSPVDPTPNISQANPPTPTPISPSTTASPTKRKRPRKTILITTLFILIILSIIGSVYYYKFTKSDSSSVSKIKRKFTFSDLFSLNDQAQNIDDVIKVEPNYTLQTGFKIFVPKTWSSETSIHTKDHFSTTFTLETNPGSTVTVESGNSSIVINNPFYSFDQTETKSINNINVEIKTGKENFAQSNQFIKQVSFKPNPDKILVATLSSKSQTDLKEFETFISSVILSTQPQSNNKSLFPQVHAQETIGRFSKNQFKNILVMWDPLPERLSSSNTIYKNSKAHLYAFESLKGERLKVVALEDQGDYPIDFVRIDFFHQDGKMYNTVDTNGPIELLDPSDPKTASGYSSASRFQLKAPYTGWYYFIVYSSCQNNCQSEITPTKLKSYSMKDECGLGKYYQATVECYSGYTEQISLENCTSQSDNIWFETAQTICENATTNNSTDLSQLAYILKILDLNQVENIDGVKFADGSEKINDPYITNSIKVGARQVALTVRFTNPIDIINSNQVRYYSKPKELEPSPGVINSELAIYIKSETYDQFTQNVGSIPMPEDSTQKIPITIYSLGSHTALIQPSDNSLFPTNHHIVLVETNLKTGEKIDTGRIFTE